MQSLIAINDLKISCEKLERSGKAIIFLHNSSGSSSVWDRQWEEARFKDYTLLRIDLPGHGSSSHSLHPEEDYTLSGMAHTTLKAIEQLQPKRYIIAAVSLATNLVGEVAHMLTGCEGFFLAGAPVVGNGAMPADILLPFEFGSVLFEENPSDEALKNYVKGLTFYDDERVQAKLISDFRNTDPRYRAVMGSCIACGAWTDEIQNLKNTGKPVAWVFGKNEQIINSGFLNKIPIGK